MAGAVLLLLGCGTLLPLADGGAHIFALVGFGLSGMGLGIINQNQQLFIQILSPPQHMGTATGLVLMARTYGGAVGSALFGVALSLAGIHDAFQWSLWVSLAVVLPGADTQHPNQALAMQQEVREASWTRNWQWQLKGGAYPPR